MASSPISRDSSPRAPDVRVIVMAKHPEPGRVKTRLARVLGDDKACALYRACILDLAERLAAMPYRVTWAYTPATAPFADLVPGARCRPQVDGDLGARMADAIAHELADGLGPVLVIGADAPHLPAARLAEAGRALGGVADVVLGPAEDGGYYLIGLRAPAPELFAGIPWSTSDVLAATRARAAAKGLRVHLLATEFDLDEPVDLDRLRALVARDDVGVPRVAALLASWA